MRSRRPSKGRRSRWRLDVFTAGVAILTVFGAVILVAVLAKIAQTVGAHRTGRAATAAAAAALGESPSVASIISGRSVLEQTARDRGVEAVRVFATLERRVTGTGDCRAIHVVKFVLCADTHDTDFERTLSRVLTAEELAALEREGLREEVGDQWKHHHHPRPQARHVHHH